MHLKSVTLRGFKSFADRTHLELDRGLVAVVGPNGAGKSNLVDALIWSLGTLSTRALRADRMEDVIFVGTTGRPALGMSQVMLTFDNSDASFPVDLSEVQIGRTLYRDGASEYSLNGATVRLLDVQELLAEAGIGRELHAVVAQGQVDDIVGASPDQLRSFVEEAAGISKHRRRAERAMRKIEHVEADIARAADLHNELKRQIRPLRAQAEQALRHHEVTQRLRELRVRLLVGDLVAVEQERTRAATGREEAERELAEVRGGLEDARARRAKAEAALEASRAEAGGMRRGLDALRAAQAGALRAVLVLRERLNATPDARRQQTLAARKETLDSQEVVVRDSLASATEKLAQRQQRVVELRDERIAEAEQAHSLGQQAAAARDEIASVEAEARSAEQAAITARAESKSATERFDRCSERIARLRQQADGVRAEIERLDADSGRAGLTVERLEAERRELSSSIEEAEGKLRSVDSQGAVLAGRMESLRVARDLTASRREGAEAFRAARGVALGVRGVLADSIRVAPGLEAAVEAVCGPVLDALVVAGAHLADAVAAAEEEGHDLMLVGTLGAEGRTPTPVAGARPLAGSVEAPGWLRGTIDALLADVWVVDDWSDVAAQAAEHPHATFVTPAGRVLRPRGVSRPARSSGGAVLGLADALERTEEAVKRNDSERSRWQTNRDRHTKELKRVDAELEGARAALAELEGRIAAAADRLRELGGEEHACDLERDLAARDRDERLRRAEQAAARREELTVRAAVLREQESQTQARSAEASRRLAELDDQMGTASEGMTELLTTRAELSERLRGLERQRDELRAEEAVTSGPPTDPADLQQAEQALRSIELLVDGVQARVRELLGAEESIEADLRALSGEISALEVEATSLEPRALRVTEVIARCDVRAEEIGSRLAREFDIPPSAAKAEFPMDGDADQMRGEEARLDAELRRMGPVNPLAASEVVELEERRSFLEAQIEDLRSSRRDLMKLVRAAEGRMRELLTDAVTDADVRFREVIGLLFPEGDGRLRMVPGPDGDPLDGGVEIEVKLGRKGHRRLAFLSGGEKALAGLGFLFALHLARPTPFLVLDEVDAPLDDANLGRFLRLLDSLRTHTQVVVVTHQKRTMERADMLVGVTLNPDGTSKVVTQTLEEHAPAPIG